jgi:hypothetical protein
LGGTINLENSGITTSGDNASGLHALGANSQIFGKNLAIVTSGRIAAGAEADNGGLIQLNGGSIATRGDGSFACRLHAISILKSGTDTFIWTTTPRVSFFRLHCMVSRLPPESAFDAWSA